jgi:hypothetical protein
MSVPIPESSRDDNPAPDDLAGVPACFEEDQPTIRTRGSQSGKLVRTRGSLRGPSGRRIAEQTPTADDLSCTCAMREVSETGRANLASHYWSRPSRTITIASDHRRRITRERFRELRC